jgi:DNA ligase (NAD+)
MLKKFLEECKAAYYAGEPIISDSQYDMLEEVCSEDLSVGTNRGRVKHWYRMYSLQKKYVGEDWYNFDPAHYLETPKLDGAAIALRYLDGEFHSALTRGDGIYGEDITHLFNSYNLNKLGIPKFIRYKFPTQINGEVVAPKRIENARNYAAGALHLDDPTEMSKKEIHFFAYDMQDTSMSSYDGTLALLKDGMHFNVVEGDLSNYPQDGKVFRLIDNSEYIKAGYTSKHPRGAFALKERSEGVETILLRVDWETGKSGKVTPVAILDPVNIDGATVSRATLNNPGFIKALGIEIGDLVMVERAGGIIPRIIKKAE